MRYRWVSLALLLAPAAAFAAADGCSSAGTAEPPEASAPNAASEAGARLDAPADRIDADAASCTGTPPPAGVPGGWVLWPGYDSCCGFYVPSPNGSPPPPIAWGACDPVAPAGLVCQQMQVNWTAPTNEQWPLVVAAPAAQETDTVTLAVSRAVGGGWESLIADTDGPVRLAIFQAGACRLQPSGMDGSWYAFGVHLGASGGAFSGALTSFPTQLAINSQMPMALTIGQPGALDLKTMLLHSWDSPATPISVHAAADTGFLENFAVFSGSTLFWNASRACVSKFKVWTSAGGTADFLSFGDTNSTEGVGDIGTDGTDIVWTYGSGGCDPQTLLYNTVSIMTSPFSTTASGLQPRRLRSEIPNGLGVSPFVVDCGYAARQTSQGIRLVRLSDGVSWLLAADPSTPWEWEIPIALTCTELFAQVLVHNDGGLGSTQYTRVRLDSLGPGTPPD